MKKSILDAIVLVSGGMDSAVTAAIACKKHRRVGFLFVKYGQRTQPKELRCFKKLADYFGAADRLVADIKYLKTIGGSGLTDRKIKIPSSGRITRKVPITYVPFRNTHLLSIGVSWAEVTGAKSIYYGAVGNDVAGYPDTTPEYVKTMNRLIRAGTKPGSGIKVLAPLIKLNKTQVVKKGIALRVPFEYTWSCYRSQKIACGKCDSCVLRQKAFKKAGFTDPVNI